MGWTIWMLLAWSTLTGLGADGSGAGAAQASGPPVVEVEIRSDVTPNGEADALVGLDEALALEIGQPLTEGAVRRTLTNLFALGVSSKIELRTREVDGGIVVVLVIWGEVVAEDVRLEGELGLRKRSLQPLLAQRAGQPLVDSQVLRGFNRLGDRLLDQGYFESQVRIRVEDLGPRKVEVVYTIDAGPRARIGEISLLGELGDLAEKELLDALRIRSGKVYPGRRTVEDQGARLQRFLIDEGFRLATVSEPEVTYREPDDRIDVALTIDLGPEVRVDVRGADRKKLAKRGALPFLGTDGYDEALRIQSEGLIRDELQRRGHYDAVVTSSESLQDGVLDVVVEVEAGPVYRLEEVRLLGNREIGSETLSELMTTAPKSALSIGTGRLVDRVLSADLDNLRSYYALQGFTEVEIGEPSVIKEGDLLRLTVPIEEGPRKQVASLRIVGAESIEADALKSELGELGLLRAPGPYHPLLLQEGLDLVEARYRTLGFSAVQVVAEEEWSEIGDLVALTLRVDEGPQTRLDRLLIRGNQRTRGSVIRQALRLKPEDPVSNTSLLEAQRRLYRLGIFSEARVEAAAAEPGATERDVLVEVREGQSRRVSYGVGYDTDSGFRALLGFSDANLAGRAWTLRGDMRWSERDRRFRLTFDQPFAAPGSTPLTYTLFYVLEEAEAAQFEIERIGGRVEAVREFGLGSRASLIYDYRIVDPIALPGRAAGTDGALERQERRIRISSLIPNVLLDRRDDPVDPSRGWSLFAQLQYAFPFLSTNEEFVKLYLEHSRAVDLGAGVVLAGAVRFGAIEPLRGAGDDPFIPSDLPNREVSVAERFFAGGTTSHRAYRLDELGLPGETLFDGVYVGGNGLVIANLDLRVPLFAGIGGVVFADIGNVWADWRGIDLGDLRTGVGLGVRYTSPIGPVRLEVGWKLDRLPGEDPFVVSFTIGNPF